MRRLLPPVLVVALAVVGALVYGQRGDAGPTVRPREGRVEVVLTDFRIAPQRIRARPGRVTFAVRNAGRVAHAFRVRRGERELVVQPSLAPGERAEVSAELPRGSFRMLDPLSNHDDLGMWGTVQVR